MPIKMGSGKGGASTSSHHHHHHHRKHCQHSRPGLPGPSEQDIAFGAARLLVDGVPQDPMYLLMTGNGMDSTGLYVGSPVVNPTPLYAYSGLTSTNTIELDVNINGVYPAGSPPVVPILVTVSNPAFTRKPVQHDFARYRAASPNSSSRFPWRKATSCPSLPQWNWCIDPAVFSGVSTIARFTNA